MKDIRNKGANRATTLLAISILILACLLLHQAVSANPVASPWSGVAPIPINRWNFGVATLNGKIYAVSGMADSREGPVLLNSTEEFNPATGTWTEKAAMPFATASAVRFPFGIAACNGEIYMIGVQNYSQPVTTSVFAYDPQTDIWRRLPPAPINATVETTAKAATVGDEIYVMGNGAEGIFNIAYDPALGTWTLLQPPDDSEWNGLFISAVIGEKIYVIGGQPNGQANATAMQAYDTITNTWASVAPIPAFAVYGGASATTGAKAPEAVYAFAETDPAHYKLANFKYDPSTDSWLNFGEFPEKVEQFEVVNAQDLLYIVGGFVPPVISGYPNSTLVYTPFGYNGFPTPTPTSEASAKPSPSPTLSATPSSSPTTSPSPMPTQPPTNPSLAYAIVAVIVVIAATAMAGALLLKRKK